MKDAGGLIRGGAAWLRPVPPEESERLRQKFVEHAERERREKFWERVQQLRQPGSHHDVIKLELDDLTYRLHYTYASPRRETRWEPREGGVTVEAVES